MILPDRGVVHEDVEAPEPIADVSVNAARLPVALRHQQLHGDAGTAKQTGEEHDQHSVISADSHADEPVEIFERLPAKYRARAPHLEERDGGTYYIQEGKRPIRQDIADTKLTEEDRRREFRDRDDQGNGRRGGTKGFDRNYVLNFEG